MDAPPPFDFDFLFLDLPALRSECITPDELEALFYDVKTIYLNWHDTDGFGYMIGHTLKSKFVSLTFEFRDEEHTIRLTSAFLSQELEIRTNYYGIEESS